MISGGFVDAFNGNQVEGWINVGIAFVLLVIKLFAFVSSLLYSAESYAAADKLNKATWTIILGVAVALQLLPVNLAIINLALTVAALVFLADVRPALAGLRRR